MGKINYDDVTMNLFFDGEGGRGDDGVTQGLFFDGSVPSNASGCDLTGNIRCFGCMQKHSAEFDICPYCGFVRGSAAVNPLHMHPGTVLCGRYIIGNVIGFGGFGTTYVAWDTALDQKVAIKEYLPSEFSTRFEGKKQVTVFSGEKSVQFGIGKSKFVDEARRLAKFKGETGIVSVYDSFEENGTAYIVMEYLEGETLENYLARSGKLPYTLAVKLLNPIVDSLKKVHKADIIHRDISPDNIFLTSEGQVKLIDFGAARHSTSSHSASLTIIIKEGYSAEEQYTSDSHQGGYTDVYSLGAVLYTMVTGIRPPDALERRTMLETKKKDLLEPISKHTKDLDESRQNAIYNAMNIRPEDRTPDIETFAAEINSRDFVKRRKSGIKRVDLFMLPLWIKIAAPIAMLTVTTLCILLGMGVIGPKSGLPKGIEYAEGNVPMPWVVGENLTDAEEKLKQSGLYYEISGRMVGTLGKNYVIMQDPPSGIAVKEGSKVKLKICEGLGSELVDYVVGLSYEEAEAILTAKGFVVSRIDKVDNVFPEGYVVSQSYNEGDAIEIGSEIKLAVSSGSSDINSSISVVYPDVVGKTFDNAKELITKSKLYLVCEYRYDSSKPVNTVLDQTPEGGKAGHQGDTIKLVINREAFSVVSMPDVVYMDESLAVELIESRGLKAKVVYKESSKNIASGCVFEQSITADSMISSGTVITIYVQKKARVSMPDVQGMDVKVAQDILAQCGLSSIVEYASSGLEKDTVIGQDVSAGSQVEKDTMVKLTVSNGSASKKSLVGIKIESAPTKTTYYIGDEFKADGISVKAVYSDGSTEGINRGLKYSGFNSSVAGTQTVTVEYEGHKQSFNVKVVTPYVSISLNSFALAEGESKKLTATAYPSGTVTWSSNNTSVATVSGGTVKGVKEGAATITASFTYNGKTYKSTCTVTVDAKLITIALDANRPSYNAYFKPPLDTVAVVVKAGQTVGTLPTPEAANQEYTFDGWYTAKEGGSKVTSSWTFNDDVTLYGHWTRKQITVTLNANGGTLSTTSLKVNVGESKSLSSYKPTRSYYTFNGWNTAKDGSGATVTDTKTLSASTTLYAQWTENGVSGWVKVENVPSGAPIKERQWTYTYMKEETSSQSSVSGWPAYYKKARTSWGTEQGPVNYDPSNGVRDVRSEKYVSDTIRHYKYYHRWNGSDKWGSDGTAGSWNRHTIDKTKKLDPGYKETLQWYGNGEFACETCGAKNMWLPDGEYDEKIYSTRWYYKEPVYTYYYKVPEERTSKTKVTAGEKISNVQEWVKYVKK